MTNSTIHYLLARFLDTEYTDSFLSNVSAKTFNEMKYNLLERFDELEEADVKAAWKEWFDWAANNGTLVNGHLRFEDTKHPYSHPELIVVDLVIQLATEAIDRL